jgi:hypothetical protein
MWSYVRRQTPQLQQQFTLVYHDYENALASSYFYTEALRRTLAKRAMFNQNRDSSIGRRIEQMNLITFQLREVMHALRNSPVFALPAESGCLECHLGSWNPQPNANPAQGFPQVPYALGSFQGQIAEHAPGAQSSYDPNAWEQRWFYGSGQQNGVICDGVVQPNAGRPPVTAPPNTVLPGLDDGGRSFTLPPPQGPQGNNSGPGNITNGGSLPGLGSIDGNPVLGPPNPPGSNNPLQGSAPAPWAQKRK